MNSIITLVFGLSLMFVQVISEENAIDYGEEANTDAMNLRAYNLLMPVSQIMKAAEKRYKTQGLTVPIELYEDLREYAIDTIPWLFNEIKGIANLTDRNRVTAQYIGEIHGLNHMSNRLDKQRLSTPLNVTGTSENLLGRIKAMENFIYGSLDDEIANASHSVHTKFHAKLIDKLPFDEAKQKNLQLLVADLSHALVPPL
ncbi:unnamed protein product [Medioppia subpectinata]|uniref:Uncharacterized protein n=1 Tax=Medioppia subpectinata TaxID=1979941 RepID=A0A7R9PVB3_9ACAR|nr:unnamed protein product [Medioppia subpectinata]CAG2102443.1 unnamed protein product [Medioppia subpectinata]